MKWLLIRLLRHRIKKAKRTQVEFDLYGDIIFTKAYGKMIETYESAIRFVEAERDQ